jgi:putative GTP pyrophosphokinase
MAFSHVPAETKNQINKAGRVLVEGQATSGELAQARNLADRWRACHAYPINTFQATLRVKLKRSGFGNDPIVAQRLKRMPTIIDKLQRYPAMQLTTMQDIGGVRAVLGTVRDEDGYRSLHLIYKYQNKHGPEYNGLRLELQIRTKLQHTWATAVETMGTFLGQALKSRQGDQEWLDFFTLTSSVFAHQENSPLIPRHSSLSRDETCLAVAKAEASLRALEKMDAFSAAVNEIVKHRGPGKSWYYHLIVLNSLEKSVDIKPYDRDSFEQAVADYSEVEAEAAAGKKIEPVLVSAGPIDKLRQAYPNFFLYIGEFVHIVGEILEHAKTIKERTAEATDSGT